MEWNDQIEQLEKNVIGYRETEDRLGLTTEWRRSFLAINRAYIEDILHSLRSNNCRIWIFRNPVSYMDGVIYNAMTQRFDSIEDVIDHFSCIHDCDIGLFQIFAQRIISPEFFEPRTSIMVRYATNFRFGFNIAMHFYEETKETYQSKMDNGCRSKPFEFLKIEEMTI